MKKFFENPNMEPSMFHTENIVTVSNVTSGTPSESTADNLKESNYLVQDISVKGVEFKF